MLHEFLKANNDELIARARAKVGQRTNPIPTEAEMKNGVPIFLQQLVERLSVVTSTTKEMKASAVVHGGELLDMGFSISQVIHGYGDVCQSITQLAEETNAPITVEEFQLFNKCQDDVTAEAVTAYERKRDREVAHAGVERQGVLVHEMGNRVTAALIAFNLLQKGVVGISGSTGAVLGRSLRALRFLVNNSLAEVRLEAGLGLREVVSVADLIKDIRSEGAMVADATGIDFVVLDVEPGVHIQADPQILSAAISNLLQNAFKFSRGGTHVSLKTTVTKDRVLFEVEDECGGLPAGQVDELFKPFEQRSANRTGLGLGLTISSKGVAAMGGTMGARDLPGKGCVFWIDLPRIPAH